MHLSVPDIHHGLYSASRGILVRNGKKGTMIIIIMITVVAVMSVTITITVRRRRR
jgi:hypothetical protein